MRAFRVAFAGALTTMLTTALCVTGDGAVADAASANNGGPPQQSGWSLSPQPLPVGKTAAIGLKLNDHEVMWLGGMADDPADNNATVIYDTRTRTSRETAPIPLAKQINEFAAAGVLRDGTVVVTGGVIAPPPSALDAASVLSYRYDPATNRWSRTGDLPEPQQWSFTPTVLLPDGRLLIAGGLGLDGLANGLASRDAFVYNPRLTSVVDAVDPNTGLATGKKIVVAGRWDYTRRADGTETTLSEGHLFGNETLLHDGRVFVAGGHAMWDINTNTDGISTLATNTEFFDPATGIWSQGPLLPAVPGEDSLLPNSHGGRTNGVCFAALPDDRVVIAGGDTATDGQSYFDTARGRQSILVMTPAANPRNSRIVVSATKIPSGVDFGGLFGDGGRNQLLCYVRTDSQVVIAGGQDNVGEDLYDTYIFNPFNSSIRQGPDLVHGIAQWAQDPSSGYPPNYQAAAITTQAVAMRDSKLVFGNDVFVEGGGFDAISVDGLGSRYVEQFTP